MSSDVAMYLSWYYIVSWLMIMMVIGLGSGLFDLSRLGGGVTKSNIADCNNIIIRPGQLGVGSLSKPHWGMGNGLIVIDATLTERWQIVLLYY